MIYLKIGIVAENKKELLEYLDQVTEYIKNGAPDSLHAENNTTGFYHRTGEDPCWDYDTSIYKHLEILD